MPVIKSAKKKLRKDRKREQANAQVEKLFKKTLKLAQKSPTEANIKKAVQIIDKTAKNKIIHSNKAARLKSKLSKLLAGKTPKTTTPSKVKKAKKTKTSKAKSKK